MSFRIYAKEEGGMVPHEVMLAAKGEELAVALQAKLDVDKIANNLTTQDEGYVLDARQGKAVNDRVTALLAGRTLKPTTLWEGTWSAGDITVPGIALYSVYVVSFDGWRPGFAIRNVGVNNICFLLPFADGETSKISLQAGYSELNAITETISMPTRLAVGLTSTAVTSNALYNITRIAGVI